MSEALVIFQHDNIIENLGVMFSPSGWEYIGNTLDDFSFGLPITTDIIPFGVLFGLFLNLFISTPTHLIAKKQRERKKQTALKIDSASN